MTMRHFKGLGDADRYLLFLHDRQAQMIITRLNSFAKRFGSLLVLAPRHHNGITIQVNRHT